MDAELLKAFEKVIGFYRTSPKYLDVVGTELFEKMRELEEETVYFCFNVERWCDKFIETLGDEYFRCFICNKFKRDYEIIRLRDNIDEKTFQYAFPGNNDLANRLFKLRTNYERFPICRECCERYNYNYKRKRFEFDVYSWINQVVECKPEEIREVEELLLNYYKYKKICKPEELFLNYYYAPEEIPEGENSYLNYCYKNGKIHEAEELLLDYYHKSGRIREAEKLLNYRKLREIREVEEQSSEHKSKENLENEKQSVTISGYKPDYSEDYVDIEYECVEFDPSEEYESIENIYTETDEK